VTGGVREVFGRLFDRDRPPETAWAIVRWWEARRIPFNLVIGAYGFVCLIIFFVAIGTSGKLERGEDAVEPMALCAAPLAINLLYTLGWIVEVALHVAAPSLSARIGPLLLKLGLGLGLALITVPAAYWGGYRVLQLVGALR
jgi:hypothetical protein